jgi:Dyp-type peroxidase family
MRKLPTVRSNLPHGSKITQRNALETRLVRQKRKQPGIAFPSAAKQEHLLIIRLDISRSPTISVKDGLKRLCRVFQRIDNESTKIDELLENGHVVRSPLSKFYFSATIGFGIGFFERLKIKSKNKPKNLHEMPDHREIGDPAPYSLAQTDLIIQLGSSKDFVNRWVLENAFQPLVDQGKEGDKNASDIVSAIGGWAIITDIHPGFQRIDGRNLMGFNDGISNPDRLHLENIVWTSAKDEQNQNLKDGTYMVFQKIEHDLDQWRQLDVEEQEEWVGRSKGTGLLLGTLSKEEDKKLSLQLQSSSSKVQRTAFKRWKRLFREQQDPNIEFFDERKRRFKNIQLECPVWSHVRKANPRQADGAAKKLIFRRGYPYVENGPNDRIRSGLLFVCFQKDIKNGFEFIKKNFLNEKDFPIPNLRKKFAEHELAKRHQKARFSEEELNGLKTNGDLMKMLGLEDEDDFNEALRETRDHDTQNTGREGLAGPSELGITPAGEFLAIVTLGGGYYFVPPIPNRRIMDIGQQFFE